MSELQLVTRIAQLVDQVWLHPGPVPDPAGAAELGQLLLAFRRVNPAEAQKIIDAADLHGGFISWDGRPPVVTPRDIPPAGNSV
jgi:hypothetical protein